MAMSANQPPRCEGTADILRLAVGIMSRPTNTMQRVAVRDTWAASAPATVLHCFLVGAVVKRTPRAPWDKRRPEERLEADGGPKGEISANPHTAALRAEHVKFGDVLVLAGSAEIHQGGTSGLKTLTWWRHVAAHLPNAEWVGKCDDDTLINVPALLARCAPLGAQSRSCCHLSALIRRAALASLIGAAACVPRRLPPSQQASPRALFGTIKWGCYSDQRLKWESSWKTWACGRTAFARSQAPGEAANLSLTYAEPCSLA